MTAEERAAVIDLLDWSPTLTSPGYRRAAKRVVALLAVTAKPNDRQPQRRWWMR